MPRITTIANVICTEDTAGENILFGPATERASVVYTNYNEQNSGRIVLLPGAGISLSFGSVAQAAGFLISASGAFDLSINGATARSIVRPPSATAAQRARILADMQVSSLDVTNASLTDSITLYYIIWGD
jgi:hypothetical protein